MLLLLLCYCYCCCYCEIWYWVTWYGIATYCTSPFSVVSFVVLSRETILLLLLLLLLLLCNSVRCRFGTNTTYSSTNVVILPTVPQSSGNFLFPDPSLDGKKEQEEEVIKFGWNWIHLSLGESITETIVRSRLVCLDSVHSRHVMPCHARRTMGYFIPSHSITPLIWYIIIILCVFFYFYVPHPILRCHSCSLCQFVLDYLIIETKRSQGVWVWSGTVVGR